LSVSKTGDITNAHSGETIFLGRSDIDEDQGFTSVLSFLSEHKVLTQAAHLYVEAPESV
jgi:hypothetical protein